MIMLPATQHNIPNQHPQYQDSTSNLSFPDMFYMMFGQNMFCSNKHFA